MTELTILSTIILTIVLVVTVNDFYSIFFKSNKIYSKKILYMSFILYFLSSVTLNLTSTPPEFNIVIAYLSMLLISLNYKSHVSSKVFGSLFISLFLLASEMLVPHLFSIFFNTSAVELLSREGAVLYLFASARFIPFIIVKIIKFKITLKDMKFDKSNELKFTEWTMIVALPICSMILMHYLYEVSKKFSGEENIVISTSILAIIMFNIIFYTVYFKSLKMAELEATAALQEQQIDYYSNIYEELKTNLSEVQCFKHDTKHTLLNAISELTENENLINKEHLYKKLDLVMENLYLETYKCYTGNSSLDMILNHQVSKATSSGISINLNISPNLDVNIDGKVISIILGNVLDNAYEACKFYSENEIKIDLLNQQENLYIAVTNAYKGELIFEDNLPKTSKVNFSRHGIGLKNIKKLVEDNQGILLINVENGKFMLQIHLVNSEKCFL